MSEKVEDWMARTQVEVQVEGDEMVGGRTCDAGKDEGVKRFWTV